ncbi:MAG: cytochrome c-type biogenesis protein CcmH [Nitrospirota bacterium]|nr:cytochrome c-type biogenesis protein CcmH [Nitrospirota bacterium]
MRKLFFSSAQSPALSSMLRVVMLAVALSALWPTHPAAAREAAPVAEDPVVEARLKTLASNLRCLVCQNQTLADSEASLAEDFRREIRTLIKEGKSDDEIVAFLVDRYGDFVRYRPPFKATTALLWFGPLLLLVGGLTVLVITLRRRRATPVEPALSGDEHARAMALLQGSGKDEA